MQYLAFILACGANQKAEITLRDKERETYFFLEKAVEYEDKHSLEGVEDGEKVRHDNRGLADEEEAEGPCKTQEAQQGKSTHDPGSVGQQSNRKRKHKKKTQHVRHLVVTGIFIL